MPPFTKFLCLLLPNSCASFYQIPVPPPGTNFFLSLHLNQLGGYLGGNLGCPGGNLEYHRGNLGYLGRKLGILGGNLWYLGGNFGYL